MSYTKRLIKRNFLFIFFSLSQSWSQVFESDEYWAGKKETTYSYGKPIETPDSSFVQRTIGPDSKSNDFATIQSHINVHALIKSYQQRGHLAADLDPLGITTSTVKEEHGIKRRADASVTKGYFNFTASDMDKEFFLPPSCFIGGSKKVLKLR